ncbi:mitochondrial 50S ribosomal protein L22 [Russula earlei]|uniref:Mitochondrial 50S ribosomal protein L22 n=1 Tax=Russula earlei TaxID=71964 RepID=A0ACC0UNQ2_9AGAM|nr:mitochondrial 50S ribosomal protein L22 [Russula earlei]
MQRLAGETLGAASVLGRCVSSRPRASTSRLFLSGPRRHASFGTNPLDWIRSVVSPNLREKRSSREIDAAKRAKAEDESQSVFDAVAPGEEKPRLKDSKPSVGMPRQSDHHKYSTANFKISHRKLNKLGRQISGKPIDSAILQMTFSEKRASKRLRNMLVLAKSHATLKGIDPKKMVVAEAWVTKGPHALKRVEFKGRAKMGIRVHPHSRLSVVLKEGKTRERLLEEERARKLKRIVSAGLAREDQPLRNPRSMWVW